FSGWTFDWHGDHPIELELSERRTQRRWFASWVDPRDWNACVHAVLAFRQSSDRHPFGVAKLLGVDASGCRELASVELPRFARMSAHGRGSAGWRRWKSISGAMHPPEKLLLDARSFDPKHSDDDAEFLDKEFSQHQVRRAPTGGTSPELPPLAEWAEPVWFVTATVHPR
ncbi:MAG: hypothetical protein IT453_03495, partial [Planctomycetes bacterium]|nr:hypothetical protein [Planctomycetota bacterium]